MVEEVALGQVFVGSLRLSPVSINPPVVHTNFHLHVALTRRTKGRRIGTFRKGMLLGKSASIRQKSTFTCVIMRYQYAPIILPCSIHDYVGILVGVVFLFI